MRRTRLPPITPVIEAATADERDRSLAEPTPTPIKLPIRPQLYVQHAYQKELASSRCVWRDLVDQLREIATFSKNRHGRFRDSDLLRLAFVLFDNTLMANASKAAGFRLGASHCQCMLILPPQRRNDWTSGPQRASMPKAARRLFLRLGPPLP
jgi:hypothetical protein